MLPLPEPPQEPPHAGLPNAAEPPVPPTAPGPAVAHQPHHPSHPHHHHHHHHGPHGHPVFDDPEAAAAWRRQHDAENRRTIRRGLAWLGGLLLVLGATVWLVLDHVAQDQAEQEARAAAHGALRNELLVDDVTDTATAEHLLARLAATRAEWALGSDAVAFERQQKKLQDFVTESQALAAARAAAATLAESREADPGTVVAWRNLLARGDAALAGLPPGGAAAHNLLAGEVDRIAQGAFTAMIAAAGELGADHAEELRLYSEAQALALRQSHGKGAEPATWQRLLELAAPRANAAQRAVFDDATIAQVPWTDLLTGSEPADWVASRGTLLQRELDHDGLRIHCSAGHDGATVLVRRGPNWQCCELAVELQLEAGEVALFPRAARSFDDHRTGAVVLRTTPADGVLAVPTAQRIALSIRLVGDQLVATSAGLPTVTHRVAVGERIGGFGLVVHPGTTLRLFGLRVRELVPGPGSAR